MTGTELQNLLTNAGLSQRGAARDLEIHERTMRRYVADDLPVPRVVDYAVRHLIDLKVRQRVLERAGKWKGVKRK